MITCKRASELLSKRMDGPLSVGERIMLGVHLCVCAFCRKFEEHVRIIRDALRRENVDGPCLPEEAKNRVKEKLRKHTQSDSR